MRGKKRVIPAYKKESLDTKNFHPSISKAHMVRLIFSGIGKTLCVIPLCIYMSDLTTVSILLQARLRIAP